MIWYEHDTRAKSDRVKKGRVVQFHAQELLVPILFLVVTAKFVLSEVLVRMLIKDEFLVQTSFPSAFLYQWPEK